MTLFNLLSNGMDWAGKNAQLIFMMGIFLTTLVQCIQQYVSNKLIKKDIKIQKTECHGKFDVHSKEISFIKEIAVESKKNSEISRENSEASKKNSEEAIKIARKVNSYAKNIESHVKRVDETVSSFEEKYEDFLENKFKEKENQLELKQSNG